MDSSIQQAAQSTFNSEITSSTPTSNPSPKSSFDDCTPERCFNAHRGTLYMRVGPMFSIMIR